MTSPQRHVDARDVPGELVRVQGLDLHHTVTGEGPPDLLLLHHFFGNTRTWRRLTDRLRDDARLIAFDRPGFGWTERPPRSRWDGANPYRRASSVAFALALLDHYAVDRAVVVGASAGGTVALELAAAHPDRVAALVLLAPAVGGDVGPPARLRPLLRTRPARAVARRVVRRAARDVDRHRVGGSWARADRVTEDDVAAYAEALRGSNWDVGLWDAMTAEPPPDLWPTLGRIRQPALVVCGDQDGVVGPRWSRRAAELLPAGEFALIPDCGHTPHEECPDAVAGHVRAFLDRLG